MRSIEEVLIGLDLLFETHKLDQVEEYLETALNEARDYGAYENMITIVNEMIGFYRDTSQYEKSLAYCRQILPFMDDLGLNGTIHYATTCLNIANACRAAGEWQASLNFYERVMEIYKNHLPSGHELYASYYNNLSLLYQEMGDFGQAAVALKQALDIIESYQDEIKIATTCSNLAGSLMRIDCLQEAEEYLNRSLAIYRKDGEKDFHYGAALSAMGELQFRKRNYPLSHKYYTKALKELEKHVGKTEYYTRTLENISMVQKVMEQNAETEKENQLTYSPGMEQCIDFYHRFGKTMISEKFPSYVDKIAVAVVGEGSHCFGYDDNFSKDHDFYPGFSLFVTRDTYEKIGTHLQAEYARLEEKVRANVSNKECVAQGRTGVCIIEEFYNNILGGVIPRNHEEWLRVEESLLATSVNGKVLEDPEGIFSYYRNQLLSYYPKEIWKIRLAKQLYHLSQYGQYNYGRMMERKDILTASQCRSFFIDSAMKMVYLLNKVYAPYYKWLYRGMDALDTFGVKEQLDLLIGLEVNNRSENENIMEEICKLILDRMEKLGLISVREEDTYLDHYRDQLLFTKEKADILKDDMLEQLILLEWKAFDTVKNEGGRAQCQDDWPTFYIMRKSQYLPWTTDMLQSYIQDFEEASKKGWNLITEKYGRMMESTNSDEFTIIKRNLPKIEEEKKIIIDEIVKIQVGWMEEFAKKYPFMAGNSRAIHTYEDSPYTTSYETYLRGEISTYSDRTLDLYGRFIVSYLQEDKNLTVDIMTNTALLYGYQGLEDAEKRLSLSLS